MYVFYGGVVITRLCLFFKDDNNHEEEAAPPTHPLLEAAGDPHPHQRRRRGSRGPDYVCPFLGCVENAGPCYTGPSIFRVPEVCAPKGGGRPSIQNSRVVSHCLLGEGATLEDLAEDVPTGEVFRDL